ncbi:MAG TPA: hypothetical protein VMC85_09740 [Desulfomonilaceae bacterium]|nr:hypothetical protein [Desulfomonilaceae bacterium]
MHKVTLWIAVLILCAATAGIAIAQWPLGRDVTQQGLKVGEPGATITVTGRFQIFVSPNVKGHTFMIDTDTGRTWIMKRDSTSGDFSFQRIPVDQIDAEQAKPAVQDKTKTGDKESPRQK